MNALNICVSAGLIALASLSNPGVARAQDDQEFPEFSKCAWPLVMSPEGLGNFVGPDDQARY